MYRSSDVIVGRYGVLRVIASGGMAEVYEAIDQRNGELRAVKTPNLRYADNEAIVRRMVREAQALATLNDPNLVKVYDAGVDETGQFFMVMELVDGLTLRDFSRGRDIPLGVVLSLVRQLARGVSVVHATGTVHRDLKPDNCFVIEQPGKPEFGFKLFDMGVAKFKDSTTTSEGHTFGTVTYMAPEQVVGDKVDQRADIYAIGLMMYELLAGKHPMTLRDPPSSVQEWAQRQVTFEPEPIERVVKGLHPAVSNIVARAIAKKPAQRFKTSTELHEQLRAASKTLQSMGQLGPVRLDPFVLPAPTESGPQPVLRARPPNTETPHAGLPYVRTDAAPSFEPEPPPAPLPLKPEPPRVEEQRQAKTKRGTVPMLGPKGTKPLLDVPWSPPPAAVHEPAPPAVEASPAPEPAREPTAKSPAGKSPAAWRPAPPREPLFDVEADPSGEPVLVRPPPPPEPRPRPRAQARDPHPQITAIPRSEAPTVRFWLQAMAVGLLLALVGIAVIAAIALRGRPAQATVAPAATDPATQSPPAPATEAPPTTTSVATATPASSPAAAASTAAPLSSARATAGPPAQVPGSPVAKPTMQWLPSAPSNAPPASAPTASPTASASTTKPSDSGLYFEPGAK